MDFFIIIIYNKKAKLIICLTNLDTCSNMSINLNKGYNKYILEFVK